MNGFEITLTVFISISLILNMVLMYHWVKAENEVKNIKIRYIKDLFWIRNGQSLEDRIKYGEIGEQRFEDFCNTNSIWVNSTK